MCYKISLFNFHFKKRGRDDWVAICQVFSDTMIPSNVVFLFSHY